MKLYEGWLCWNPGNPKSVRAVTLATPPKGAEFSCFGNMVYGKDLKKLPPIGRKAIAFMEAMVLIVRDSMDPMAVHKAMLNFDEYRDGCSEDMPGMEKYEDLC